jgi:hypothetical protein
MIAINNGGTPAVPATAIAGGASSALVGVAPGPIVEMTSPSTKNMIGRSPARPRQICTARPVTCARVPLHWAMLNRSVTPISVTSNAVGNPSSTVLTDMPPRYTPTSHASASDSTPTLMAVVQLSATASTSAAIEIHARGIGSPIPAA